MKSSKVARFVAAISLLFSSTVTADQWDMALAYSASNFHSKVAAEFAQSVTEATSGKLTITTHPEGSLVDGVQIYDAVQTGKVAIGERLISALGSEHFVFEVDALPFLATSYMDARKLHLATKPYVEAVLEDAGLVLLYSVPWTPQGLYTQETVSAAADLKGMNFRTYNHVTRSIAEQLEAVSVTVQEGQVSAAFESGQVESMITSAATGYDRRLWEYINYWYDLHAWVPKNMVFVNRDAWNELDSDTQNIVLEAAQNTESAGWKKSEELAARYKNQLGAQGMQVLKPGDQLRSDLTAIGETIIQEWLNRSGELGASIVSAYKTQ